MNESVYNAGMDEFSSHSDESPPTMQELEKVFHAAMRLIGPGPGPTKLHMQREYYFAFKAAVDSAHVLEFDVQDGDGQEYIHGMPLIVHDHPTPRPFWFEWASDITNAHVNGFKVKDDGTIVDLRVIPINLGFVP